MIDWLLSSYRSVIALNGDHIQNVPIRKKVPVIAADGAARWIDADYVVGDGDSFKGDSLILMPDQSQTDFEKCIAFAREKDLFPALIIGMNGGEIDHVFGNMHIFLKYGAKSSLFFVDWYPGGLKIGIGLEPGIFQTKVKEGATISLFSFGCCVLSTQGLVWELKDQRLVPNGLLAVRNRAKKGVIEFCISQGTGLAVIDL